MADEMATGFFFTEEAHQLATQGLARPPITGQRLRGRHRRLYERILQGRSDANLPFKRVRTLLFALGFEERLESSHHVFTRWGIDRPIPLQDGRGGKCKPYQVRMIRDVLLRRDL